MISFVQFDRPGWLILTMLVVPVIIFAWGGLRKHGPKGRAIASVTTRCILILLISVAIARPVWNKAGHGVSLITVLDRSQSIPRQLQQQAVESLQEWTSPSRRGSDDRLSVISVGREAMIGSMPDKLTMFEPAPNDPDGNATNLSKGVQLAMALLPSDTASRILLVSDGNETDGEVRSIANLAKANGVPIDVLPMQYQHQNEVLLEKVVVPSQSRQGQSIPVRVILRSIEEASGTLHLLLNGVEVDISPDVFGNGLDLLLESGVNAVMFDVPVASGGPQKIEATWNPTPRSDTIATNNTGIGVSFVTRSGTVLLVTQNPSGTDHIRDILLSSGMQVDTVSPQLIPRDSIGFSKYDSVILSDIPRWALDDLQERHLHAFVHDLGGGLFMTGGPESFGAGGWIGSLLEQAMPIKCEPPQSRQLPRGALALIMHSCEMPKGNYWGQKMASAAIDSLSEMDYVGIIEYDWNGGTGTRNNSGWTIPMHLAGNKVAAHDAINRLVFGDMQDFGSPMGLALDGLIELDASQKHVIIITDGDPIGPSQELLESYRSAEVTISTVMVGGHGSAQDQQKMQGIATATGGRFYMVNDPQKLPNIFIKEAQLNSRSLLQEGNTWDIAMRQSIAGPVRDISELPPIHGYVVAGMKGGFSKTPWHITTSDGEDPVFAWWHYGLGKSIAFTSDLGKRWTTEWPQWSDFSEFLEGSVRWSMRGTTPPNMMVNSRIEGSRGIIDLEAVDAEANFMNFMRSQAVLIDPLGKAKPIALEQTGPGRYHAEFEAVKTGAWLVNIAFQDSNGESTQSIPTAIAVPYSREYATTMHNTSLLAELASLTGGRVLSFDDMELINLFDDTGLITPQSPQSVWDLLAMISIGLLLLDVAIRRLWIDKKQVQSMFAPIDQATTGSVDALRRIRVSSTQKSQSIELDEIQEKRSVNKETTPKKEDEVKEIREDNLGRLLKKKRDRGDKGELE
ncbi:MAG: VWA domain-containing protein [Planctomycetota bacterium]|nr:VWA domain-containing protein [Planctomycetota bacterium]